LEMLAVCGAFYPQLRVCVRDFGAVEPRPAGSGQTYGADNFNFCDLLSVRFVTAVCACSMLVERERCLAIDIATSSKVRTFIVVGANHRSKSCVFASTY